MITSSQFSGIFGITSTTVNIMTFAKDYFKGLGIKDMGLQQQGDCLHYDIKSGPISKIRKKDLPKGWSFKRGVRYKGTKSEVKIVCFYKKEDKQYISNYEMIWN
jgi:hypothetical protein